MIGFIIGFVLTILVILGLVMFGQAMVGDPNDVVPEEEDGT
ncbi:hypothetical protein ACFQMF_03180 [Halorubrum rutilum]|uniref:Uncharacterized protein n=1 Tax=Halorubrum rutilum TaxID=1364933 RepID=A0ABD6AI93_9EURY|nr:hypothetical protein [Halorubrum rutilum]